MLQFDKSVSANNCLMTMETSCHRTWDCALETGEAPPRLLAAKRPFLAREGPAPSSSQPRLLDRLRLALRSRHYSRRTENTYLEIPEGADGMALAMGISTGEPLEELANRRGGTMMYTHVLNRGGRGVKSPVDSL